MMKKRLASMIALSVLTLIAVLSPPAATQTPASKVAGAPKELRVGIVTLLSGPASSTFGIPAKKAADAWVEKINDEGGIGGGKIVPVLTHEAGPRRHSGAPDSPRPPGPGGATAPRHNSISPPHCVAAA